MEFIIAVVLLFGLCIILLIPYLKYMRYRRRAYLLATGNGCKLAEVSLDSIFSQLSTSIDTHHWNCNGGISRIAATASGYERTINLIVSHDKLVVIESKFLVVPFEEFVAFSEWHALWIADDLLITWNRKYKEGLK